MSTAKRKRRIHAGANAIKANGRINEKRGQIGEARLWGTAAVLRLREGKRKMAETIGLAREKGSGHIPTGRAKEQRQAANESLTGNGKCTARLSRKLTPRINNTATRTEGAQCYEWQTRPPQLTACGCHVVVVLILQSSVSGSQAQHPEAEDRGKGTTNPKFA